MIRCELVRRTEFEYWTTRFLLNLSKIVSASSSFCLQSGRIKKSVTFLDSNNQTHFEITFLKWSCEQQSRKRKSRCCSISFFTCSKIMLQRLFCIRSVVSWFEMKPSAFFLLSSWTWSGFFFGLSRLLFQSENIYHFVSSNFLVNTFVSSQMAWQGFRPRRESYPVEFDFKVCYPFIFSFSSSALDHSATAPPYHERSAL